MNYLRIESALQALQPIPVFKLDAPDDDAGRALTRYIVWTPTGARMLYAEGRSAVRIGQAMVTVCTQTEDDTLPSRVIAALEAAHVAVGAPMQEYSDTDYTWYTDIPCEVV